ncbi:MAG: metal-binding protein [Gallionella sp.]|jgi:uncharacterized protein|nr:metal-binding protein [Gallionella sp.]
MHARPFIDSLDFASNGQQISSEVLVAELSRLADVLSSPDGTLSYTIRGEVNKYHIPLLVLHLSGSCQLTCQRCMQSMSYELRVDTSVLLRDQTGLDRLDDAEVDEEYESILADTHLDVWHLLEDEILLSLPFAPKHELGSCRSASGVMAQQNEPHPFAALMKLKS